MARDKIEHLRAKEETVKIGQKDYTVEPLTNGELLDLIDEVKEEWNDISDLDMSAENLADIIRERPVELIDEIVEEEFTEGDWLNAYPNDVYNLVVVFKEVNFTFLNKLKTPLARAMQYLQQQNPMNQQE